MEYICQCGCGQVIPPKPHHRYKPPRYILEHWLKIKDSTRIQNARATKEAQRLKLPAPNPSGLCQCGCGQVTPIARATSQAKGQVKGEHIRFIHGHHTRGKRGPETSRWKGGRWTHKGGYVYVYVPEHPHANRDGYVYEHRIVAEQMLGRPLDPRERVHHIDGCKTNNEPSNLVVFGSQAEHRRSHGTPELERYYAEHPEERAAHGRKGAAARWRDHRATPDATG